jgi:glycosyltransferase involved in cell wall biosynthesis
VDDGSTDNTAEVVDSFRDKECKFPIRYFSKENGGKHTAINYGVQKAGGELFLILDSDDELPKDSLASLNEAYQDVKDNPEIGGVCGYMAHRNGDVIGSRLLSLNTNTLDLQYRYDCTGDMAEVFKTEVLREFPFPEIDGEKFCPEDLIWNQIACKYLLHVFPKVVYFRDYLDGGLTDNIVRVRMQSPVASMILYSNLTGYDVPMKIKIKSAINYWRFWFCASQEKRKQVKIAKQWAIMKPMGWMMHAMDGKKVNKA